MEGKGTNGSERQERNRSILKSLKKFEEENEMIPVGRIQVQLMACAMDRELRERGLPPHYRNTPLTVAFRALRGICQSAPAVHLAGTSGQKVVVLDGDNNNACVALSVEREELFVRTSRENPFWPDSLAIISESTLLKDFPSPVIERSFPPENNYRTLSFWLKTSLAEAISKIAYGRMESPFTAAEKKMIAQILYKIATLVFNYYKDEPEPTTPIPIPTHLDHTCPPNIQGDPAGIYFTCAQRTVRHQGADREEIRFEAQLGPEHRLSLVFPGRILLAGLDKSDIERIITGLTTYDLPELTADTARTVMDRLIAFYMYYMSHINFWQRFISRLELQENNRDTIVIAIGRLVRRFPGTAEAIMNLAKADPSVALEGDRFFNPTRYYLAKAALPSDVFRQLPTPLRERIESAFLSLTHGQGGDWPSLAEIKRLLAAG